MFKSAKHRQVTPVTITPVGGLRLDLPPQAIEDAELTAAENMLYQPNSAMLVTRPAFRCLSTTPLNASITNVASYNGKLVVSADDSKIYLFNIATGLFSLHTTIKTGSTAQFIVFNNKLLWADGESLYSWDGTTIVDLTPALKPSSVVEILSRVVINDTADHDAVYFSAPEDETDWDTSAGGAIGLRAGYGDNMEVNALAVLGQDVIVSKSGRGDRFMYRINTAGMPMQWSVMKIISDTSASDPQMFISIPNDILYLNDDAELRSLSGISEYGDLEVDNAGNKVNTMFHQLYLDGFVPSDLTYLPSYDIVACCFSGKVGVYYNKTRRFTFIDMLENDVKLMCCCEFDNDPYLASNTGNIYMFNENGSEDEYAKGQFKPFSSKMRSKRYFVPGDVIVRRIDLSTMSVTEGKGIIEIVGAERGTVQMMEWDMDSPIQFLADANEDLYDANDDLAEGETEGFVVTSRRRTRVCNFYFQVRTLRGRVGIASLDASLAVVNG